MGMLDVLKVFLSQELEYTNARDLSYSEVACVTVLTWDVLVMLSEEVELIWKRAWTPAKTMYLIARYIPWLVQLALLSINVNGSTGLEFTDRQCAAWQVVQGVLLQVIVTTVDVILITRVYALYSRSRVLLGILGSLFVAELTFLCYVLAVVTPRLTYDDECYVTSSPAIFQYYWCASSPPVPFSIVSLLFETILFALTMFRFCEAVRQGWGRGPVLQQFVSDGTWAYALVFATMLVNMMLYKYVRSTLTGICYTWLLVVLSLAGSRLVLNPRRASAARSATSRSRLESSTIELTRLSGVPPVSPVRAHMRQGGVLVTIEHISDVDTEWEKEGRRSGSTVGDGPYAV
ncbi:uncharacterized protein TRAVEDRAFT_30265 [Trametes versicolor FP-101664 SS1]|uniref:uncharacterized protein n=1 Tax=Trametes versicolor (strain FP-101664) TaxID=717944 RepID=UPI000462163F|nr:uncharacterized protein TRAVEDRAFT_30265 [Trametes versicolor FP-101664 SS1]EIW57032.1 hypothetical protein TRAVEDRAFT_30265 [Trametes versicolor FP-101664 SS1]